MDATKIIAQGEMAKFVVGCNRQDFDPATDDWQVQISYGTTGLLTFDGSDLQPSSIAGQYILTFDTTPMTGEVIAKIIYQVPDVDCENDVRQEVDMQLLCVVVTSPFPKYVYCHHETLPQAWTYTRTDTSGLSVLYQRLCARMLDQETGVYGPQPLTTADGLDIYVRAAAPTL